MKKQQLPTARLSTLYPLKNYQHKHLAAIPRKPPIIYITVFWTLPTKIKFEKENIVKIKLECTRHFDLKEASIPKHMVTKGEDDASGVKDLQSIKVNSFPPNNYWLKKFITTSTLSKHEPALQLPN